MSRTKRMEKERKTVFATRVITEYGDYISAEDAWREQVDKRGVGIKSWTHFQSNLSDSVRFGWLTKKRGENMKGKRRVLYGPPELWNTDPKDFAEFQTEIKHTKGAMDNWNPQEFVEKVQRPNRVTIEDIPLGDILNYHEEERDDIMSVLTDLIYDTPLRELRLRYPTLEDLIWSIVGVDE